jgi:hypothetical protein
MTIVHQNAFTRGPAGMRGFEFITLMELGTIVNLFAGF